MNLVGKIFTVLIFLMCVVFGTFALMTHAAHTNWRQEVIKKDGLNDQLVAAKKIVEDLTGEKKILETELAKQKDDLQKRIIALQEAANSAIKAQKVSEDKVEVEERKSHDYALAIQEVSKELNGMQVEIEAMRGAIQVAVDQRNSTAKKLVETTNDLNNTAAERIRLEKLGAELAAKAVKLSEALKYAQISLDNFKKVPPAGLSGLVTAVPLPDVVEISLGADDGVSVGNRFNVTRPSANKYIGVIEVIKVDYPNRAVCRPDTKLQSDQIQKGDRVEAITKTR